MENIKYYIEKYKVIIILIAIIIILLSSLILNLLNNDKKENVSNITIEKKEVASVSENLETIKVDVKGYVQNPGVYELDSNSRVMDAIYASGGLLENANTEYINLSKKLVDEMVIIIYSNEEADKFKSENSKITYKEYECECPDNINDACISEGDIVNNDNIGNTSDEIISNGKVSINTATLEELMTLDGIGQSKAEAIIKYREENGGFKSLEEIMNISGIGEKVYTKIKDNITL